VFVLSVAALPFLLVLPIIFQESNRHARDQLQIANQLVIRQTDSIIRNAFDTAESEAVYAGFPCENVLSRVAQLGIIQPYFRAVLLVDNNRLYCSSVLGKVDLPLDRFAEGLSVMPQGRLLHITSGTPMVPNRPAMVVLLGTAPGRGVLVTVDSRYMLDMVAAVDPQGRYAMHLKIGNGHMLTGADIPGMPIRSRSVEDGSSLVVTDRSSEYPVEASTVVDPRDLVTYRRSLWWQYFPFLLVLSAGIAWAAHRVYTRRQSMASEIRKGMRRGEFQVHYQPVVDLDDGHCVGAEALMRWSHPTYGNVRPDLFIPVAEENNLAVPLTRHLLTLIKRDLNACTLPPDFHLAVNLTAEHMCTPEVLTDIQSFLHDVKGCAPRLSIELTERTLLPDTPVVMENMQALRRMGVALAIDDFGTGHSSLAYLERFTVDYLKIDRGFVSAIDTDAVSMPVLELIIALGPKLNVRLIAEGIETDAQAAYLRAKGVTLAQGHLFAHPMSMQVLVQWLAIRRLTRRRAMRLAEG
jgi:sensor c-di-GMP phosphodiesterase-like protein